MIFGPISLGKWIAIPWMVALFAAVAILDVSASPVSQASGVDFTATAETSSLAPGDIVELTVRFDGSSSPVSAVQAYLDFNPTVFTVVDSATGIPVDTVTPGPIVSGNNWTVLQNSVDNAAGTIDFAAGKSPISGNDVATLEVLATFHLEALTTSPGTNDVSFAAATPRQTKAVSGFTDVTGILTPASITISNTNDVTFDFSIQGWANGSPSWSMPVDVELYQAGTDVLVSSGNPTSASSSTEASSATLSGVSDGTYDVWFKGENTLSKLITGVVVSQSSATVILGEQVGGDATGGPGGAPDDIVDVADYSDFLLIPFNTSVLDLSLPEQRRQDHNQDGRVDINDYAIIVANFSMVGAPKP